MLLRHCSALVVAMAIGIIVLGKGSCVDMLVPLSILMFSSHSDKHNQSQNSSDNDDRVER